VLGSIGGWSYRSNFSAGIATLQQRATFVSSAVTLLQNVGLDGLDLDFEYPATDAEGRSFIQLLTALRQALDAYSKKLVAAGEPHYHFQLTTAMPVDPAKYKLMHLKDMAAQVDFMNLMAYDFAGPWYTLAANQAALYYSPKLPHSTPFNGDTAVRNYIAAGVPSSKVVLGMPLYGRSFTNTSGLGQSFSGAGLGSWEAGVWDYKALPLAGATEKYDPDVGAVTCYNSQSRLLVSYDNAASARQKAEYIKKHSLGGAMYWESSADKDGANSIISTVAADLGTLDTTPNCLSYPFSVFPNVKSGTF